MTDKKRKRSAAKKNILFAGRRTRPCEYCSKPLTRDIATLDHVRPVSKGGYDRLRNCVLACRECNQRKGNMSREQFLTLLEHEARGYAA